MPAESASSGSVTITLPNDQHSTWPGNNAGSHRFWITTNEPTKFPVPAGGDGQPNDPNDSSDGPKANETDVTWATVNLGVDYNDDGTIDLPEETTPAPNEEDPGAYILLNSGLVPVIVDYAPSGTDNATLTLKVIQSGKGNVKVWKDVNKTNAITLPKTWNLKTDTVPGKIYVEGVAASSSTKDTTLELAYSKGSGQNVKDDVKWTIVKGDLTAYRPQQSGGSYAPFSKTAVSDADEMKSDLGPGIRIDNPGDNDPNGEDDCIELKITDPTQNAKVVLERSSSDLKVWQSSDETGAITFTNNKSSPLTLTGGNRTVWVEWAGTTHGTATLTLESDVRHLQLDEVEFHAFSSIIVVFRGFNSSSGSSGSSGSGLASSGVFKIANVLYNEGYDPHVYESTDWGSAAEPEVETAVASRHVSQIAVFGHSWGGGATYNLCNDLHTNNIGNIVYSAYIDGIKEPDIFAAPEDRLPPGSPYHVNLYEDYSSIHGVSIPGANLNLNVRTTTWGSGLEHTTIDDDPNVRSILVTGKDGSGKVWCDGLKGHTSR